ncbi:CocE/NonD family hydrolase [Arthrobacter sp. S2(2024)]|uniref:CocE/NonD family hydrolase n=1 Tax=Arthrobacter sp. S2(2024) TaxID=3111911 RepID=UPI002FC67515
MAIEYVRITPAPVPDTATPQRVRMRDGVWLATDVYLPENDQAPGPTILIRLPYDKNGEYTFIPKIAEYMTRRGYRVVAQDVRGKFRSEGESLLFVNEVNDGYDTIEWVTRQNWSNGDVAMWGDSYYGYTQWAAVSSGHPALKAIAPRVTGTGLGELPVAVPGADTRDVEMGIIRMYPLTHFHSNDTYEWEPDWSQRPYIRDLERFQTDVGQRSASFDLWYPNPVFLRRFPNGSPFEARPVPVLNTIGWWDNCAPWSWRDHEAITSNPGWAHNEYLLLESIDHENYYFGIGGPAERDDKDVERMLPAYLDPALEFFDVFVRGTGNPADIPRVRWNLAGTTGYRRSAEWPPAAVQETELLLTGDLTLTSSADPKTTALSWQHDPDNLVPSPAKNAFAFLVDQPDERALSLRADVADFTGPAVEETLNLVGPVRVRGRVWSTGPRADVFARLYDLAPDGTLLRIARGQVHIMKAETPVDVDIDLGHVGYQLAPGHRLRLHLQSSDFPEFIPQPGTAESPWTAVDVKPTTQSVQLGGENAATLVFSTLAEPGPALPLVGGAGPDDGTYGTSS